MAKMRKKTKRYAVGGSIGYGGTNTNDPAGPGGYGGTGNSGVSGGINGGGQGYGGPAGGVTTGTVTGTSATNRPAETMSPMRPSAPKPKPVAVKPKPVAVKPKAPVRPVAPPNPAPVSPQMFPAQHSNYWVSGGHGMTGLPGGTSVTGGYGTPGYGSNGVRMNKGGMVKGKKMASNDGAKRSFEELKEYKKGKYTGGPAEEKAEKKKKGKRMADGGMIGVTDMMYRGHGTTGATTGSIQPMPRGGRNMSGAKPMPRGGLGMGKPVGGMENPGTFTNALPRAPMRGGGIARKGVGQALAKGGMVKGSGCVQRGIKKPRYS